MTDHTTKAYDEELQYVGRKIAEMGGIAEQMLVDAMDALTRADADLARKTVAADARLDLLEREVEERVVLTIARRQPVAIDLRAPRAIVGLKRMSELVSTQLKDLLDAYARLDVERADYVWRRDAEVDALDDLVCRDLLTFMMEDPRNITFCTHLLFCSKNIERIGDHATNIAEKIHYLVTGSSLPVERPRGAEPGATS